MNTKIVVDIRPIISVLHHEWDGEESNSFNRFIKKNKNTQRITDKMYSFIPKNKIEKIDYTKMNDRIIEIHLKDSTREEIQTYTRHLTLADLMAYPKF